MIALGIAFLAGMALPLIGLWLRHWQRNRRWRRHLRFMASPAAHAPLKTFRPIKGTFTGPFAKFEGDL